MTKELGLGRNWVLWEHYDNAPDAQYGGKKTTTASWSNWQKIAWFNDIITFWQLWESMPFSKLEKYFYSHEQNSVPVYMVGDEKKRIATFSLFETGIQPNWEDATNKHGSEYRFNLSLEHRDQQSYSQFLNKLWENFVVDLISGNIPHA